jgi:hypothetical protein
MDKKAVPSGLHNNKLLALNKKAHQLWFLLFFSCCLLFDVLFCVAFPAVRHFRLHSHWPNRLFVISFQNWTVHAASKHH